MIFKNRTLRLVTLAVLASCLVVGGEPEPRRGSKVSPKFSNKSEGNNKTVNSREGKVFSLFNIVQFNNGGCRSTSTISGPTGCGCLQYHTGLTGRFTSFNFAPTNDNHLANQDYSICIRQEAGFCCIEYSLCPDANSFSIDTNMMLMMAKVETECFSVDYITIEGGQGSCSGSAVPSAGVNRYCGDKLNPLTMEGENVPICGEFIPGINI
eukprot:TCALIF_13875-PA protein Name:"Protein of unknown function" AED:0.27 eAED:0.27 QI:14/0.75/0.8/1/1/1/5/0/209